MFDRITGKNSKVKREIEIEAYEAAKRDQVQRDDLVVAQAKDRKDLQKQFDALRYKQRKDRKLLSRSIGQFMKQLNQSKFQATSNQHEVSRGEGRRRPSGIDFTR